MYTEEVEVKDSYGRGTKMVTRLKVGKIATHISAALGGLILALNSYTTVPAGHAKVQTLFGSIDEQELNPGFHIVNPLAKFTTYDGRNQTYSISDIMVPSQDKLKTDMDISVIYSFNTGYAPTLKKEVGDLGDLEAKILIPNVRSIVREIGKGVEKSQDFFLDDVQQEMQQNVKEKLVLAIQDKGITIHDVLFRDVTLPMVVSNAIIQTKQRQEEINQERAKLEKIKQQAQQKVVQARASEEAAVAQANAQRTMADAKAYSIEQVAKATAKGNSLINKTLTKDLIESNRVEKWDGKYPTTLMSDGAGVLLNMPNK